MYFKSFSTDTHNPRMITIKKSAPAASETALLWALLIGNFVIGTGVMLVPGTLNNIASSMQVNVATAGQLITAGALTVCIGAPLLAFAAGRMDRRNLLAASMLWYALLHAACVLAPGFATLMGLRILALISAAIFTPQAAAVAGALVSPERRGRAITTVFLGRRHVWLARSLRHPRGDGAAVRGMGVAGDSRWRATTCDQRSPLAANAAIQIIAADFGDHGGVI
jgi:hypothetical protein